jgi:nicotinamidase-related amidase
VLLTEQNPQYLGKTLDEIKSLLPDLKPIEKLDFDCCAVSGFSQKLESLNLSTIILFGVESHVCVLQSCLSLLERVYRVHVPRDAIDSRTAENRQTGLELMAKAGAVITSTETVIFQLLKKAGTDEFRTMLKIVK